MNSKKNEKEKKKEISEEEKKQISEEAKKMNELFFTKYSLDSILKNLRNEEENMAIGLNKNQIDNFINLQLKEKLSEDDNIYSNKEFFKLMNTNSENADEILILIFI